MSMRDTAPTAHQIHQALAAIIAQLEARLSALSTATTADDPEAARLRHELECLRTAAEHYREEHDREQGQGQLFA